MYGAQVSAQLNQALERLKRGNSRTPALSPHLLAWLQAGWVFGSLRLQRQSVRSGALLAALYEDEGLRALVLESAPLLLRIPRGKLIEDLPELVRGSPEDNAAPAAAAGAGGANMGKGGAGRAAVLDAYTIDLTAEAAAGKVDPIVGRDAEIRQIIDVLMRRRQNNPILTGEAGVGKTAIVEGFAQQITGHDHNERIERLIEERARVEELRDRLSARFAQEKTTVERIEALEREIQSGAADKNAAALVDELGGLRLELEALQEGMPMVPPHVDLHVVATAVSGWTGIPVGKMLAGNLDAVRALRERMTPRIVGQDAALDAIRRRIQTFHADLGEPSAVSR